MDGCGFLGFTKGTIHSHYKAWKSQDIFNDTDCVWLKEKIHIQYTYDGLRVNKLWDNFLFWVN